MLGGGRRELGVAVVLAEEDDRQLPDRGEVHRLVERALGHRAVAEEGHRDAAVGPELRRGGGARRRSAGRRRRCRWRRRCPSFGSAMCIEPPRPRLVPCVLAHQLGEHPERVEALGQAVAVAAVGRGDDVVGPQRPARADRRGLLADREVHEAGDLAVAVERGHPLLEPADQQHPAVHLEQVGVREGGGGGAAEGHEACIVLVGTTRERAMTDQIEIPESFPGPGAVAGKRVVITGAGRGLGRAARPRVLRTPAPRWRSWPAPSGTSRRSPRRCPGRRWCSAAT